MEYQFSTVFEYVELISAVLKLIWELFKSQKYMQKLFVSIYDMIPV